MPALHCPCAPEATSLASSLLQLLSNSHRLYMNLQPVLRHIRKLEENEGIAGSWVEKQKNRLFATCGPLLYSCHEQGL